MIEQMKHPTSDLLQAYLDLNLDQREAQEIIEHLEGCPACRREAARLESLFARLDSLPALELKKDLAGLVISQLREESALSPGLTWTLVIEALGAGTVISLLIPALRAVAWLPLLSDAGRLIQAAVNGFLTQLASNWLVWWAGLQLSFDQFTKSLSVPGSLPVGSFSPWILVLAAGGIWFAANYLLLRSHPISNQNHNI